MIIYMGKSITFLFFYILADLCNANNGSDFKWAKDPDEKSHLWKARHDILYACMALKPGSKVHFECYLFYFTIGDRPFIFKGEGGLCFPLCAKNYFHTKQISDYCGYIYFRWFKFSWICRN